MKRRRAREYALQMLFQLEFTTNGLPDKEFYRAFWAELPEEDDEDVKDFAQRLVAGAVENMPDIDAAIKKTSEHWVIERMAAVDRNLIRIAGYEILYASEIPTAVTINEALEIAKRFSTKESASFINGILDNLAKKAIPPIKNKT